MNKRDYYKILGVNRLASDQDLKRAYRSLARKFHPDLNPGNAEAEAEFKAVAQAYEILNDPQTRQTYDRFGHDGFDNGHHGAGAGFEKVEEIFEQFNDLFGDVFQGFQKDNANDPPKARRGKDITVRLDLSFDEAIEGAKKAFTLCRERDCERCDGEGSKPGSQVISCDRCGGSGEVSHKQVFFSISSTCPECDGKKVIITNPCDECDGEGGFREEYQLSIQIPAGVEDGTRMRVRGEGELGEHGGARGDVIVILDVAESPMFERDGLNLHYRAHISFIQAALGCTLRVPTLDGEAEVTIPAGAQFGDVHTLKGVGVTHVSKPRTGNILVHLIVTTPRELDERARELLTELASLQGLELEGARSLPSPATEPGEDFDDIEDFAAHEDASLGE